MIAEPDAPLAPPSGEVKHGPSIISHGLINWCVKTGDALALCLAGVVASIGQSAGAIPPVDVEDLGPRRSLMLARPSVMAFMNVKEDYRSAADAVLSAVQEGILHSAGKAYRLSDAAQAHADLEGGRTSGSLYLVP